MTIDWDDTLAAIWRPRRNYLRPVRRLDSVQLEDLLGIDAQKQALATNTERFLAGKPANNALLWGSRGTGKSSLIKALLNDYGQQGLRIIEIDKDDLVDLPEIVDDIRELPWRFVIFCDDLSFEEGESSYKHLKSVLEGSIELPPENTLIYATSNRRHLVPERQSENTAVALVDGELHYGDAVEEKLSLADRFGLWLSFYPPSLQQYLKIVDHLFSGYTGDRAELHLKARQFAQTRASRSGRAARQFYQSIADTQEPL
ncbi:MAG: ATP-binding protein [Porticoccaceae bacterium]|nr:ATP-binding protein [Porticoccaceae bacterium]